MTDIIRLIVKIILIILLPLILLIFISGMNELGVFENIKNLFSNDDNTNEVVVDPDVVNPDDVEIPDDGTHLIFNNVPINGSLKHYVAQMEKKNFRIYVERFGLEGDEETKEQKEQKAKLEAYKEGKATMVGDFADFKKCRLYVETLANKDLVYKIQVEFQYTSEWEKKKENYFHLKQLLTKKYGAPTSCTEKLKPETMEDYDINNSFHKKKSKYETIYKTDKGDITLYINKDSRIILEYLDKKNSELITEHALEEL